MNVMNKERQLSALASLSIKKNYDLITAIKLKARRDVIETLQLELASMHTEMKAIYDDINS